MRTINCPECGAPLPDSARRCENCGSDSLSSKGTTVFVSTERSEQYVPVIQISPENGEKSPYEPIERVAISALKLKPFRGEARASLAHEIQEYFDGVAEDKQESDIVAPRETWQKVVEQKTPVTLPVVMFSDAKKETSASIWSRFSRKKVSPHSFFWLCLIGLLVLSLGGTFGVVSIFARNSQSPKNRANAPTLQALPITIALGGIVTLRGAYFPASINIALSYDQRFPLLDTGGASTIQTDVHGSFSDTIIIDPSWVAGTHTLDATSGQAQVKTRIMVTGQSALQGPPHILLSSNTLNLGSGDDTSNGSNLLALSNAGGGQVNWQASVSQPWLQISPESGSIASGRAMSVMVAAERANLTPGSYAANIVFTSSTEQVTLMVTMKVIPLQAGHQAILRLSPAALNFNGSAGGPNPPSQVITVSDPGNLPLTWGTTIYLQNGHSWLSVVPTNDSVNPGGYENLVVKVNTQNLSAGNYQGKILFSNWGTQATQGSPQSVYVGLVVTPPCMLAFTPNSLSFVGTVGQASPDANSLSIAAAEGCKTSQSWNATVSTLKGGNWLQISQDSGSTPSHVQVSVNSTSLGQGTYAGTLTFTTSEGSQVVRVNLTLNPAPCIITESGNLALQGVTGQSGPVSRSVTLGTTGSCPNALNWTSAFSVNTPSGGTWLSGTSSGMLPQTGSASLNIQASLIGLSAGIYTGTVTINAVDSVSNASAGMIQIAINLTVQPLPLCTLQMASAPALNFATTQGTNPATPNQSFTISAKGNCNGNVTITASGDSGSTSWLSISPASISVSSGGTATFTVTVTSSALAINSYTGTITLNAADSKGPIAGSWQSVSVLLAIH